MLQSKGTMLVMGLAAIGLVSGVATLATAPAPSQDVISKLDNNQGIFVDKKSFDVKGNSAKKPPISDTHKNGCQGSVCRRDHLSLRRALHCRRRRRQPTFRLRP